MGRFSRRREEAERLAAEVLDLRRQLEIINSQLGDVSSTAAKDSARLDEMTAKSVDLDARITQVGSEVTHQLTELSTDLERLAHEQARYQIAFRQDLAEVADLAKKKTS
jgi:chromosome segregation ATPase